MSWNTQGSWQPRRKDLARVTSFPFPHFGPRTLERLPFGGTPSLLSCLRSGRGVSCFHFLGVG